MLGCVGAVVGPLALLCCGKDQSHNRQICIYDEDDCLVQLFSVSFTCASLFFIVFGTLTATCLKLIPTATVTMEDGPSEAFYY